MSRNTASHAHHYSGRVGRTLNACAWLSLATLAALSQAVLAADEKEQPKADGKWHGNASASVSYAAGNTRSSSLALSTEAARDTGEHKLSFYGQALGSRADSTTNGVTSTSTTANQWKAGVRYDHNLTETTFGFVAEDLMHDRIQLLSLRSTSSLGLGYHLIKTEETKWDLLSGLTYRDDRYNPPGVLIGNRLRMRFSAAQLLLGEESDSKLTPTTSFKQRLVVTPNLGNERGVLATFDASLMVAISESLSLKVTVQDRYNSLSQAPIKKNDVLFLTGINVKFGD